CLADVALSCAVSPPQCPEALLNSDFSTMHVVHTNSLGF
uniref:Uncharacterized protein n=1 Tax=Aegilops tauschii subsp. strangulata TaxID=200361 RepID=A0A453S8Y3_AEGTS